ncbi:MAG: type II toxin-antitoxin system Phd/YefM family antitoxin [Leptospira sp.]|nr:type II toxin-antitoxin system Phd/YefM family antitoxin [Leptospira sp.]
MAVYNIHDAKTHFSKLVQSASEGEDVIIAKSGKPLLKLVPYTPENKTQKRALGFMKGEIEIADDFDASLPPEIQKYFEGRD